MYKSPYKKFQNKRPTRKQAINAYNEYLELQKRNVAIPQDLQDFINHEISILRARAESGDSYYGQAQEDKKIRSDDSRNHQKKSINTIIYYLYNIDKDIIQSTTKEHRKEEIAKYLKSNDLSPKKTTVATKTITRSLDSFIKLFNLSTEPLQRLKELENLFSLCLFALKKLSFDFNTSHNGALTIIKDCLNKTKQQPLTHDETKYLLSEIIREITNFETYLMPINEIEHRKKILIENIKMIPEIQAMKEEDAAIEIELIYKSSHPPSISSIRRLFDNEYKRLNLIQKDNLLLLEKWQIHLDNLPR